MEKSDEVYGRSNNKGRSRWQLPFSREETREIISGTATK